MIGFESGGRRLTTRLIAGEYIKYMSRFPEDFGSRGDMPAVPLAEAVKRVALVAERGSSVRLSFGHGRVTIEAGTEGQARAQGDGRRRLLRRRNLDRVQPALPDGRPRRGPDRGHRRLARRGQAPEQRKGQNSAKGQNSDKGQNLGQARPEDRSIPDEARIRLQFTSPTKPALITGSAGPGDDSAPDYRYLVVPLRALASA